MLDVAHILSNDEDQRGGLMVEYQNGRGSGSELPGLIPRPGPLNPGGVLVQVLLIPTLGGSSRCRIEEISCSCKSPGSSREVLGLP